MRKKAKKVVEQPKPFDGILVGSIFMVVGLLWYFIPMACGWWLTFPRNLFPIVVTALGALTIYRHWRARKAG